MCGEKWLFFFNLKSLLMLDSCRAHVTPEIKTIVNKYSKMGVIPGSLTKKLQPLDITVNKPFKDQLRAKWENWMIGGIHEYNKTGWMKRPSYKDIVAWIVEMKTVLGMVSLKHEEMKRCPVTVIMYMALHFQKWKRCPGQ
jgi:hypothetical protein